MAGRRFVLDLGCAKVNLPKSRERNSKIRIGRIYQKNEPD